jgi:hypothetical protein
MPCQPSGDREDATDPSEDAADEAHCRLCGRPVDPIGRADESRPLICDACVRGHVPRVTAHLNKPWWR